VRRRVRGLAAVVLAAAAIGGVFGAPASAEPPVFEATVFCDVTAGGGLAVSEIARAGEAQRSAIAGFNAALKRENTKCVPGTRQLSVERFEP